MSTTSNLTTTWYCACQCPALSYCLLIVLITLVTPIALVAPIALITPITLVTTLNNGGTLLYSLLCARLPWPINSLSGCFASLISCNSVCKFLLG